MHSTPIKKARAFLMLLIPWAVLAGCQSGIVKMKPIQNVEITDYAPAAATPTQPATETATEASTSPTQTATATAPATDVADIPPEPATTTSPATMQGAFTQAALTQPQIVVGHHTLIIDPNQTDRFIYKANYNRIWNQSIQTLIDLVYRVDRQDYRLGLLQSFPTQSAQIVEPWRRDLTGARTAAEDTINSQRRTIRITISLVPHKPEFYKIGVQVLVERFSNPSENIGGPVFTEGSGFGRNTLSFRSDFGTVYESGFWYTVGHDVILEKKILNKIFSRI